VKVRIRHEVICGVCAGRKLYCRGSDDGILDSAHPVEDTCTCDHYVAHRFNKHTVIPDGVLVLWDESNV